MAPSKSVTLRSETAVSLVDPDQSLKASKALLAHMKKASKEKAANAEKKDLLADPEDEEGSKETPIWLTLTTKRHISDSRSLKPGKIVLPHSLNTDPEIGICLITAEPQRHYKNLVASDDFPADLRKRVTRVIDVGKLKAKFKTFEAQRKLFAEHDVFLGDTRIINRLPGVLGKTFYKTTAKRPIPVEIQARVPKTDGKRVKRTKDANTPNACTSAQLAGEIERAVGAALINLSPTVNTAVRVGHAGWTAEQIAENVDVVAKTLVEKFVPGKWKNVKSIYVKGPETAALPIWLTDELWLEQKDVVADGSDEAKAIIAGEKANIGKKRKSLEGQPEEAEPVAKKAKKTKAAKVDKDKLPESDDTKLDKEIADRKAALKKQKKAAKKALEV
ncbi:ribosomal protein L1 [Annulohypoxylon maeteangense]|uniref:ribosomal protein L1 n=1 Tax=Annulohypoxylon maeteangense TaxID=1927788 RepID=UPI0020077026|nr:ribosomal protein L1 [Annulohypoxylon maeteangense]KAI0889161.1 ribosomal protein L1 [Annulohypoxylon maeteangense]